MEPALLLFFLQKTSIHPYFHFPIPLPQLTMSDLFMDLNAVLGVVLPKQVAVAVVLAKVLLGSLLGARPGQAVGPLFAKKEEKSYV